MTDTATTSIPSDVIVAAASAMGDALGLGAATDVSDDWPSGEGLTVLAASVRGDGIDGGIVIAVADEVAAQLTATPDRLQAAFRSAIDAVASLHGLSLQLGDIGTTDEAPMVRAQLTEAGEITAHFGLSLTTDETGNGAPGAPGSGAAPFEPALLGTNGAPLNGSTGPLALLHDVQMDVTVELGRTTMPIRDLLSLQPGMVVEIDRAAGSPIDVLVNGRLIACGEVVVIDEEFGIRITEIVGTGAPG